MIEKEYEDFELPSELRKLKEGNPFVVPHNYFKELPDDIINQVRKEATADDSISWLSMMANYLSAVLRPRSVLAVASVIIVLLGVFWWSQTTTMETVLAVTDFDQEEVATYILDHIDEFSESDFYTNEAASIDPMEESFDEQDLDPLLDAIMDDIDLEVLEDLL